MTDDPTTAPRNGLLFICTGNGTRSQMAEAFARFIGPSDLRYYSAGTSTGPALHADAIRVMREVGVPDFAAQRCKTLDEIPMDTVATIITLCADEVCPPLSVGVQHLPWPIPDPSEVADGDSLDGFRHVRDLVRELVSRLF